MNSKEKRKYFDREKCQKISLSSKGSADFGGLLYLLKRQNRNEVAVLGIPSKSSGKAEKKAHLLRSDRNEAHAKYWPPPWRERRKKPFCFATLSKRASKGSSEGARDAKCTLGWKGASQDAHPPLSTLCPFLRFLDPLDVRETAHALPFRSSKMAHANTAL